MSTLTIYPSSLRGAVRIPASKSHTIRALLIATLADGTSNLGNPLNSGDTQSCVRACQAFGADIAISGAHWRVRGNAGNVQVPATPIDVGNSGTTLYFAMATAALAHAPITITGDYQIQRRPATALLTALNDLGARATALHGNGCAPVEICGPLRGGTTTLACPTSQYLSSLLINCPLAVGASEIVVPLLNEKPYVEMTLEWLARQNTVLVNDNFGCLRIPGGQQYQAFSRDIPADFSSATFFLVAAAITGGDVTLNGLDMTDSQGDKAVVAMLQAMGAKIEIAADSIRVRGGDLQGCELDLNATPDALPALAVAGCFARGETRLVNVAQARIKETDRIAVMCTELAALGAAIEELPDGLIIKESALRGGTVVSHDDHRVVMALAVAGLRAAGPVTINGADALHITFPNFAELLQALGAQYRIG
ncbi:MAG: 3-phosphoshikimate 1-carboxyvinyltransferase [bacterium]|nr:3-phosphoshikimate 1-carboxyvinyltransferase [bacterium]